MMPATAASTSAAVSRFIGRSAAKPASKSGAAVESLTGIDDLAQAIDPGAHLIGARLQRRPVDDEAGGDIRDALDLDEPVRDERRAGLDEVDDAGAEPQHRGQ